MLRSIIHEDPLLAGAAISLGGVFLILLASAVISALRGGRKAGQVRREPVFHPGFPYRPEPLSFEPAPAPRPVSRPPRRPRAAVPAAFLLGAIVGGIAVALFPTAEADPVVRGLVAWIADMGDLPDEVAVSAADNEPPADASPPGEAAWPADPAEPAAGDVAKRLAAFARMLRENLPRDAGPELSLATVEVRGTTLRLGYAVGRPVPEAELADFDAYIMRSVRSLLCSGAREVRSLNEGGVSFHMAYTDPAGETVAEITVPPGFCA